tara:strand:+ start:102 stop:335 length:234 start_codon:yes stop_codon:yes gene_type:complete
MTQTISDLHKGDTAIVVSYGDMDRAFRQKLVSMGLTRGAEFTVVRKAPLGDPIQIKVGSTSFSLRVVDAKELQVKKQ